MAYREVELSEEEKAAASTSYVKFNAIGDTFVGVFLKWAEVPGKFGPQSTWYFKTKDSAGKIVEMALSAPTDADKKLKKAALKPGWRVKIQYAADQDVGKASPMKIFKVWFDDAPAAAPKPPPPPSPADDIAF